MTPRDALKAARAAGIKIKVDGNDLLLEASARPPDTVLELLSLHKADILALLRPGRIWTADDWRALFDERAGIAEFDGNLSRHRAEAQAFDWCVIEWLSRNPEHSLPGRCVGCGSEQVSGKPLLPFGVEPGAWLHLDCRAAWQARRKAMAVAALASMGIEAPASSPDNLEGNGAT